MALNLAKLSKNPTLLKEVVIKCPEIFLSNEVDFVNVLEILNEEKDKEFLDVIKQHMPKKFKNFSVNNKNKLKLAFQFRHIIGDSFNKIYKEKIENSRGSKRSIKKHNLKYILEIDDFDVCLSFINCMCNNLTGSEIELLINKYPQLLETNDGQTALNSTKAYFVLGLKNDKQKLLRAIIQNKGILGFIEEELKITAEDIENLPSISRFNFVEKFYTVYVNMWNTKRFKNQKEVENSLTVKRIRNKQDKLELEIIEPTKMNQLLFASSLHKTLTVSTWLKKYEEGYERVYGKA